MAGLKQVAAEILVAITGPVRFHEFNSAIERAKLTSEILNQCLCFDVRKIWEGIIVRRV